jgi:hypothetical protein
MSVAQTLRRPVESPHAPFCLFKLHLPHAMAWHDLEFSGWASNMFVTTTKIAIAPTFIDPLKSITLPFHSLRLYFLPTSRASEPAHIPSSPLAAVSAASKPRAGYRDSLVLVSSYPRILVPSYPRTLVTSYPRNLVPSYPRTLVPSYPRMIDLKPSCRSRPHLRLRRPVLVFLYDCMQIGTIAARSVTRIETESESKRELGRGWVSNDVRNESRRCDVGIDEILLPNDGGAACLALRFLVLFSTWFQIERYPSPLQNTHSRERASRPESPQPQARSC